MLICYSCGLAFSEDEALKIVETHHELEDKFQEEFYVCPNCHGDFDEAFQCADCEKWFMDIDIHFGTGDRGKGYCDECLKANVTLDNFKAFATADTPENESTILTEFVWTKLLKLQKFEMPPHSSKELNTICLCLYNTRQALSEETQNGDLLEKVREFVVHWYADEFVDFLNDQEENHE